MKDERRVRVTLNGTAENPYRRFGLTHNPFKQVTAPFIPTWAVQLLADLESRPITDSSDLAARLEQCTPEFRRLCLSQFTPGQAVTFHITWED